jgi:hypothetical protein
MPIEIFESFAFLINLFHSSPSANKTLKISTKSLLEIHIWKIKINAVSYEL